MSDDFNHYLGRRVSDKITGFAGTVTAIAYYLHGIPAVRVESHFGPDNKPVEPQWVDVTRIQLI